MPKNLEDNDMKLYEFMEIAIQSRVNEELDLTEWILIAKIIQVQKETITIVYAHATPSQLDSRSTPIKGN